MRTNIEIDDNLIARAQKLGNIKTKKAVVEKALEVFIRLHDQERIRDLWGKVKFFDESENNAG